MGCLVIIERDNVQRDHPPTQLFFIKATQLNQLFHQGHPTIGILIVHSRYPVYTKLISSTLGTIFGKKKNYTMQFVLTSSRHTL